MANEGDIASDQETFEREISIQNAKLAAQKSGPKATGFCLYCAEPQAPEKRWCDNYCRDDWQDEENARRRATGGSLITSASLQNLE